MDQKSTNQSNIKREIKKEIEKYFEGIKWKHLIKFSMMKLNKVVFAGNPDTPFSGARQQELGESKRSTKTPTGGDVGVQNGDQLAATGGQARKPLASQILLSYKAKAIYHWREAEVCSHPRTPTNKRQQTQGRDWLPQGSFRKNRNAVETLSLRLMYTTPA